MGYERSDRRYGGYPADRNRDQGYGADQARSYGGNDDRGRDYNYQGYGQRDDRGPRFNERGADRERGYDRSGRGYGNAPQGYDYQERGFFERAGDEVRSWFGDDDAERRRRDDERNDMRSDRGSNYRYDYSQGGGSAFGNRDRDLHRDSYQSWRDRQVQAFDQDYDEYRREHQSRFENEFHGWRQNRQGQRDLLGKVREHQEVVGSDGQHVGTVDHVRGDRIKLTKADKDAGGHHHSIPSSWLQSVDDKVTISKTADQAKQHWRDEQRNGDDNNGLFGNDRDGSRNLNRSFSGTY